MGWELRRGKRVYYRKVREGSRVRSIYCGSGERGETAALEDEERRAALAQESRRRDALADAYLSDRALHGREYALERLREALNEAD